MIFNVAFFRARSEIMKTIIDGYNLIFQCGLEGRTRNSRTIELARERLVSVLARRLTLPERENTTIVFDARKLPVKETSAVSKQASMTIVYAIDHDDADSLIEVLIAKDSVPKQLTVVSSDHRLHKAALRRKATPIDSDEWYEQLLTGNSSSDGPADAGFDDKPVPESLKQIDWAKEFAADQSPPEGKPPKSTYNPFPDGYGEDLL